MPVCWYASMLTCQYGGKTYVVYKIMSYIIATKFLFWINCIKLCSIFYIYL